MTKYGLHKTRQPENPPIDLVVVPHQGRDLIVSPAFGPKNYRDNVAKMQNRYSHDSDEVGTFPVFTFRPATTSESLSTADYGFENEVKPKIFDTRGLQAGRIVRTSEGVFTNTQITDEIELKSLLANAKKVNRIYLIDNRIAYAPYDTFQRGIQEAGDFREGGLARALEHTRGNRAENLAAISDKKFYGLGVNVLGFDPTSEPVSRVVGLGSDRDAGCVRLNVGGDGWGDYYGGYAFGVFDSAGEASTPNK